MKLRGEWFNSTEMNKWLSEKGGESELEELTDFFSEVFGLFEKDADGRILSDVLKSDWNLFTDIADVDAILTEAAGLCGLDIGAQTKVRYQPIVMDLVENWKLIKAELKDNRRFLMDQFIKDKDQSWNWCFTGNNVINKGSVLFRGRTNVEEDKPYETEEDLSAPPKDKATSGRVNPFGISHLYLTDSPETVLYELRAVSGDQISIGEFEVQDNLNVVDFTVQEDLYDIYSADYDSLLAGVQKQFLFNEISEDMSHPIRRYDNPNLDYLPTQLVCEYIRIHQKEDGVIFQSSRKGKGFNNIVVFNKANAHLVKHYQKTVGLVDMKFLD